MTINAKAVELALSLVLKEPYFVMGAKSTAVLSYVVSQALEGKGDRLKAYNIGVNVLDYPIDFDPQNDARVRVMASRIRTVLNSYNSTPNAATVEIKLEIGSYMPIFTVKQSAKV